MPYVDRLRSLAVKWVGFVAAAARSLVQNGVGFVARLAALVLAGLCFFLLLTLRDWHGSFAASPAWADAARAERLEWSPLVADAAERLGPTRFRSEESFRRALYLEIDRLLESEDGQVDAVLPGFRASLHLRGLVRESLRKGTAARAERLLRHLDALASEAASAAAEDAPKSEKDREWVVAGPDDASTLDALGRMMASLEGEVARREEGRQAAYAAALPSARPVDGFVARAIGPARAIRIGDETDALHVVYVGCWYGLEGLVVLLLCAALVPLLLRFAGNAVDRGKLTSQLRDKIKSFLGGALGQRAAAGAMKVIAAAAVGSFAVTGVAAATRGDAPDLVKVVSHEPSTVVEGRGEPGREGPSGERGSAGEPGRDPTPVPPTGSLNAFIYVDSSAEVQTRVEQLSQRIVEVTTQVEVVARSTAGLGADVGQVVARLTDLELASQGMATRQAAWMRAQEERDRAVGVKLESIETAAVAASTGVAKVSAAMEPATAQVSLAASDLMRTNAIPDGLLVQSAPWSRYTVTPEVVTLVRRALREPDSAEAKDILAALEWMQEHRSRDWIGQYRTTLRERAHAGAAPPEKVDALLRELLPLILRISRVRR